MKYENNKYQGIARALAATAIIATTGCEFKNQKPEEIFRKENEEKIDQVVMDQLNNLEEGDISKVADGLWFEFRHIPAHTKSTPIENEKGENVGYSQTSWSGGPVKVTFRGEIYNFGGHELGAQQRSVPLKHGLFNSEVRAFFDYKADGKVDMYVTGEGGSIFSDNVLDAFNQKPEHVKYRGDVSPGVRKGWDSDYARFKAKAKRNPYNRKKPGKR
jgi:hypothetical protein|tara:strand:- start:354 stop:1001 length:648 start_codon:yes stop_codon:yes gene_type:complete